MDLRLGSQICLCDAVVAENGLHGLGFQCSAGRYHIHAAMNSICFISCSLTPIHQPNTLEPIGLHRHDGKRPDGVTSFPWSKWMHLSWDATFTDSDNIENIK